MSDLPPRLIAALADRYRIERELGEGGMATVYLARDLRHERDVALKVLRPELAAVMGARALPRRDPHHRQPPAPAHPPPLRLRRGRLLPLLRDALRGGRVAPRPPRPGEAAPVAEASRIAKAVAGALDFAHRKGVVHRDIKPANILLQDGQPLVADFGIALAVAQAGGGRLTETGTEPRHAALHEPRAGHGGPGARRPRGRVLAGVRALRDARGRAAVHRGPARRRSLARSSPRRRGRSGHARHRCRPTWRRRC